MLQVSPEGLQNLSTVPANFAPDANFLSHVSESYMVMNTATLLEDFTVRETSVSILLYGHGRDDLVGCMSGHEKSSWSQNQGMLIPLSLTGTAADEPSIARLSTNPKQFSPNTPTRASPGSGGRHSPPVPAPIAPGGLSGFELFTIFYDVLPCYKDSGEMKFKAN